ncbi:MAG: Dam family site-specific DNA-(adenine-N6)-methyltransferase [Armatimonadetes bacterium]|jgi:DNA adenine methylase|nr:Dam family site-specific DNA-(adenine-N6)-methyltransferase [Armatimonadota bacterium]
MTTLPLNLHNVGVPPIKCQGIKTKLVRFIFRNIKWESGNEGKWVEPFLGSGVVALNLAPNRAILSDTNKHIIGFYQAIQSGEINGPSVRAYLEQEGSQLAAIGDEYYYTVRSRFNRGGSPLDLLFLSRACFNGLMRFNRRGEFNTPFGHKPKRFSRAYITKIVNQVIWTAKQMHGKEWVFRVATWEETFADVSSSDFVYLDPPYIGRHTDYFNTWDSDEAERLAFAAQNMPCGFALSMWLKNRHRKNEHIDDCWPGLDIRICRHFYHLGATEELRGEMDEALIIKPGFSIPDQLSRWVQPLQEPVPQFQLDI